MFILIVKQILYVRKMAPSFRDIIKISIPNIMVTIRPREKPWVTSELRRAIRKRNRLSRNYQKCPLPSFWIIIDDTEI